MNLAIFFIIFTLAFSGSAYSFDIFDRDEATKGSVYRISNAKNDAEEAYLKGDYKSCVNICESITRFYKNPAKLDSIYYLEGLSYLKLKNFSKARIAFDKILDGNPTSSFAGDSILGVADSFFCEGDFENAASLYGRITQNSGLSRLHSISYYRLAKIAEKLKKENEAAAFLEKLKKDYPLSLEAQSLNDACAISPPGEGENNLVQVGSFKVKKNAEKLCDRLNDTGYDAYIDKVDRGGSVFYKVIVKPFGSKEELEKTVTSLKKEGYPARVCP